MAGRQAAMVTYTQTCDFCPAPFPPMRCLLCYDWFLRNEFTQAHYITGLRCPLIIPQTFLSCILSTSSHVAQAQSLTLIVASFPWTPRTNIHFFERIPFFPSFFPYTHSWFLPQFKVSVQRENKDNEVDEYRLDYFFTIINVHSEKWFIEKEAHLSPIKEISRLAAGIWHRVLNVIENNLHPFSHSISR